MKAPSLTLGIEEEYQIIDPETRELRSYITEILNGDHLLMGEVKPELHQSMVEIGTRVCRTPAEARAELVRLRGTVMELAGKSGLVIAAAGTHPFSSWLTQEITPLERYLGVKQDLADLAQQLLIFGTHVHVGIEDRDFLIDAMNVARYFVPHVLTLSDQLTVLDGTGHGTQIVPKHHLQEFPEDGHTTDAQFLDQLRLPGGYPDADRLHPECLEGVVGYPPQPQLSHPGVSAV